MELEERCDRGLIEGLAASGRWYGSVRMREWPEAVAVRSELPTDMVNLLVLLRPPESFDRLMAEAGTFFGPRIPWKMMVKQAATDRVQAEAPRWRLQPHGASPGMLLNPLGTTPAPPPSIRVEAVANRTQLADWSYVAGRCFGIPRFVLRRVFPQVPSMRDDPPTGAFVGYDGEGTPVASSFLVVARQVATVYMVGTLPRVRRRGYGAALTWAALAAGRAAGADTGALNATPMGRPVYERMGFRVYDPYLEWHPPTSRFVRWRALASILSLAFRSSSAAARAAPDTPPSATRGQK